MRTEEGFTLLEMIIAIAVCSLLISLSLPLIQMTKEEFHRFPEHFLYLQSEAMRTGEVQQLENGQYVNSRGNINQAKTLWFDTQRIIVELGFGRLVFPDE